MDKMLVKLRTDLEECRQRLYGWQLVNVYGKPAEELVRIDIGMRDALRAIAAAEQAYNTMLNAVPASTESHNATP